MKYHHDIDRNFIDEVVISRFQLGNHITMKFEHPKTDLKVSGETYGDEHRLQKKLMKKLWDKYKIQIFKPSGGY